jgi:hypothetical protein
MGVIILLIIVGAICTPRFFPCTNLHQDALSGNGVRKWLAEPCRNC